MAIWSQALPGIAYTLTSRRSTAGAFVVLGGMVAVLANVIGETVGRVYGSNLVVGYLVIPFTAGAYILALAAYQVRYVERLTLRIGLGLFVLIYVLLVGFFEDFAHFGQYSHTLYSFVLLVAALWTLGRRSLTQEDGLAIDTEWFWVAFGLAIYGAATSATAAIGNILMARDRVDLFVKAWNLRAVLVILAFLAITWGVYRGPAREAEFAPNQ